LEATIAVLHEPLQSFATVAAWSGLRLFEVAALEKRDVQVTDGVWRLHVRHGKGDKERHSVLLSPGVPAMQETLERMGWRGERWPWIWRNAGREQWNRKSVGKHWGAARKQTGLDVGFHVATRHFHATYLVDQGKEWSDIAIQLGHFDWLGRPNTDLIRSTYGHVDHDKALARVAAIS